MTGADCLLCCVVSFLALLACIGVMDPAKSIAVSLSVIATAQVVRASA